MLNTMNVIEVSILVLSLLDVCMLTLVLWSIHHCALVQPHRSSGKEFYRNESYFCSSQSKQVFLNGCSVRCLKYGQWLTRA